MVEMVKGEDVNTTTTIVCSVVANGHKRLLVKLPAKTISLKIPDRVYSYRAERYMEEKISRDMDFSVEEALSMLNMVTPISREEFFFFHTTTTTGPLAVMVHGTQCVSRHHKAEHQTKSRWATTNYVAGRASAQTPSSA